jgi:pimeloyl-ACP methyl ester carboxylesterase
MSVHLTTAARGDRVPDAERVRISGGRVVLVRRTPGHGMPVVLLHGLLDCSQGWDDIQRALQGPTIAVDLPGFGSSCHVDKSCLGAYADGVAEALSRLGVERFVLVGHSLGGGVATAVAERMREQVAALVVLAPAGFGRVALAEAASLPLVRAIVDRVFPHAIARPAVIAAAYRAGITGGPPPEPSMLARLTTDPARMTVSTRHAVNAIVAAGLRADAFHRRRIAYHGPVHAVWGDRDRVVPFSHLARVEAAFRDVRSEVWKGMGHHHQREQPARLVALIERVRGASELGAAPLAA